MRARQLCDFSRLPCLALELLQQGLERGLAVDWRLLHAVRTLDTLVYEVQDPGQEVLELAELEQLPALQQVCVTCMPGSSRVTPRLPRLVPL